MPEPNDKDQQQEEPKAQEPKAEPKAEPAKADDAKKYTDADVDAIIDKKFAELSAKLEKKYSDQLKHEKDKLTEAQKLEKMNEQEKAKYNADKLQARIDELEREKSLSEQMAVARKTLKEADINVSDELLSLIVSPDAETTKKAVDSFKDTWTASLNSAVQDALKRNPPKSEPTNKGQVKSEGTRYAEEYNAKFKTA